MESLSTFTEKHLLNLEPEFGRTEMGRDLLSQDYILKQLTASFMYPEEGVGETFWNKIHERVRDLSGFKDLPVNTFNKVWIVPDKAVVYQHESNVYILESHLKVMMENDYVAMHKNVGAVREQPDTNTPIDSNPSNHFTKIMQEIILPEIEKEVNVGKNFAKLRQVYHSLILAKWYKQNLKTNILNRLYSDKSKNVGSVREQSSSDITPETQVEHIYQQYLKSFKTGVYDYIKEDYDPKTQQLIPRKYFSGGLALKVPLEIKADLALLQNIKPVGKLSLIEGLYKDSSSLTLEDLNKIPVEVLQSTNMVFEKVKTSLKNLKSTNFKQRIAAVSILGLLMKTNLMDQETIHRLKII